MILLRRLFFFLAAIAAIGAAPAFAQEDPVAVVRELYRVHAEAEKTKQLAWLPPHQGRFFTRRLARLIDAAHRRNDIGFDFIYDGQDFKISDLGFAALAPSAGAAVVEVRFKNFGEPRRLQYTLRRENDSWKIADIAKRGPKGWRLSKLLAGG